MKIVVVSVVIFFFLSSANAASSRVGGGDHNDNDGGQDKTIDEAGAPGDRDGATLARPLDSDHKNSKDYLNPDTVTNREQFPFYLPKDQFTFVEFQRDGCRQCAAYTPIIRELNRLMIEDAKLAALKNSFSLKKNSISYLNKSRTSQAFESKILEDDSVTCDVNEEKCRHRSFEPKSITLPSLRRTFNKGLIEEASEEYDLLNGDSTEETGKKDNSLTKGGVGRFRGTKLMIFSCHLNENYCSDNGIKNVPTIRLYRGEQIIGSRTGALRLSILLDWLSDVFKRYDENQILPPQSS